ncbi:hypothetical protein BDB01DRAFT_844455 [Pilobolus umbonatus]|nr:hypothetical protein BDB01DRAFT_844455 [Pilobolus umbonatus]
MHFKNDDYNKRVPVFLKAIRVKIMMHEDDSTKKRQRTKKSTEFKVIVEYGDGPGKISWTVYRRYWDFVKLHYSYMRSGNRARLPKFPVIPSHLLHHNKNKTSPDQEDTLYNSSIRQPHMGGTSTPNTMDEDAIMALVSDDNRSETIATPYASEILQAIRMDSSIMKKMELYLNQLIASIDPCGSTNRLCKFLEISTLGIELAALNPHPHWHGKELYAVIKRRSDKCPKHSRGLIKNVLSHYVEKGPSKRKSKAKWFIVREDYLVCVMGQSSNEIYDVFLFDGQFDAHRSHMFGRKNPAKPIKFNVKKILAKATQLATIKTTVCMQTMQGTYHLRTASERHAKQLENSLNRMASLSIWCQPHRFDSFAPIRSNCHATWFVDGRDYFWDVSIALENAKETIYIHDWWLFLRRPAAHNHKWRLDHVLKRKADQGVKVYIVMYKEVAVALPLFSHLAKKRLLEMSPNIFVQRHPSRALDIFSKDNIFFWAHHEKICVVDNEIAYIGGLDLCFGRHDTHDHILTDDRNPEMTRKNDNPQIWPGKDYSNPRLLDFRALDKPFEDNMDRSVLPRMPWHDVSMRLTGQAARDVSRHFVQRWNYLRRKKSNAPKRPTPMLLPSSDSRPPGYLDKSLHFHPTTSEACNVQILRSVSSWSIGAVDHTEKSIQNAYVECIGQSKSLVYIVIENQIGEALYQRILKAHENNEKWRAVIVIPLIPGFQSNIDEREGGTVRLIMQFQYMSIGRGPDSLLGRLHAAGVKNTHHYINFYGLRNWGELNGQYVTEQVYIHAKLMIVDDRIVIMGSANINERSQLGSRDSEIAACVEDTELTDSVLGDKPVKVGRFAHSLRMSLMCEHVGLDIDQMEREKYGDKGETGDYLNHTWLNRKANVSKDRTNCVPPFIAVTTRTMSDEGDSLSSDKRECCSPGQSDPEESSEVDAKPIRKVTTDDSKESATLNHGQRTIREEFWAKMDPDTDTNGDKMYTEGEVSSEKDYYSSPLPDLMDDELFNSTMKEIYQILKDPLSEKFQYLWHGLARINSELFRRAFLVTPDNNVRNWNQYHEFGKMAQQYLGRMDPKHSGISATAAAAVVSVLPINNNEEGTIKDMLDCIKGHLVIWPNHFMEEDDLKNEFLSSVDKLVPAEIFN